MTHTKEENSHISIYFNVRVTHVLLMSGNSMNSVLMDYLFCFKLMLYFAIGHFKPSLYTSQLLFRNISKPKSSN